jgi:hypothetical protein
MELVTRRRISLLPDPYTSFRKREKKGVVEGYMEVILLRQSIETGFGREGKVANNIISKVEVFERRWNLI